VCGHFDSKIIYGLRVVEAEREREGGRERGERGEDYGS